MSDVRVVNMKEWLRNDGIVDMLEQMLEYAKDGTLVGAAGVFMLDHGAEGPALGMMVSENMGDHVFTVAGALDVIKLQVVTTLMTEDD